MRLSQWVSLNLNDCPCNNVIICLAVQYDFRMTNAEYTNRDCVTEHFYELI